MVCFSYAVRDVLLVLLCLLRHSQTRSFTGECIRGTQEVYMPDPKNGKCQCGALLIDPEFTLVYASGFCDPYPSDEGLSFRGCRLGANDEYEDGERKYKGCEYYCLCEDKQRDEVNGKLTCCRPTDRFGIMDKVIIAAPPPPGLTTTTVTTMTLRKLTTVTTTSEPYYGPQQLQGYIDFSTVIPFLEPPASFLEDPDVLRGVSNGIALKLGVPYAWVETSLSIPERYIQADYKITVPDKTMGNTSAYGLTVTIVLSADEDGRHEWSDIIGIGLSKATDEYYTVYVHNVYSPTTIRLNGRGSSAAHRTCISGWSIIAFLPLLRLVLLSIRFSF